MADKFISIATAIGFEASIQRGPRQYDLVPVVLWALDAGGSIRPIVAEGGLLVDATLIAGFEGLISEDDDDDDDDE